MLDPTDQHAGTDSAAAADSHAADCCTPSTPGSRKIASHFDDRIAERLAESESEFPEMVDVSRMLLELLDDVDVASPSLLELGCGSGALTVALLKRGARRARGLDLSPGMLAVAVKRAEKADVADRVSFSLADAAVAPVEPADWVLMDRVICCYAGVDKLMAQATRAATRRVCFTVPTSRGWRGLINKVMWRAENIPLHFGSSGCPGFVHSVDAIERTLSAAGFKLRESDRLGLWYAAVWDRGEVAA